MARFIPRPEAVVVGHRTYSINWIEDEHWDAADHADSERGVSNHVLQHIDMRLAVGKDRMLDEQLREVLLHEIMHCVSTSSMMWVMWDSMDRSKRDDVNEVEEMFVAGWTPMLMLTLKQNPEVLAYLLDDKEHK